MSAYTEAAPKVGFFEAIKLYFANYVNFKGRARRSEFWWVSLFNFLVTFLIGMLIPSIASIYSLIVFLPSLSLAVRRLHDVGKSGWWYLLIFVPFGGIFLIVWACTDSKEDNQWGPNPKCASGGAQVWDVPVQPIQPIQPVTPAGSYGQDATVYEPEKPQLPDPEPKASVTLYLYSGPMAGTSFKNPVGRTVTLGRNPSKCDILLSQYDVVSGTHCQIGCFADYITIVDLNSTNGTYVNGVRLTPHQPVSARNGATIYLANSSCAFQVRFQ